MKPLERQDKLIRLIDFISGRLPVSENWWKANRDDVITVSLKFSQDLGLIHDIRK